MKEPLEQAQRYLIPCLRDFRETQPPQRKVITLADDGKKMLWWPFLIIYSPLGLNSSHASPPICLCCSESCAGQEEKSKGQGGEKTARCTKGQGKEVGGLYLESKQYLFVLFIQRSSDTVSQPCPTSPAVHRLSQS